MPYKNHNKPEQEKLGTFNPIEYEVFGHAGDDPAGVGYYRVSQVDGAPIDSSKSNPSFSYDITGSTCVISQVIGTTTYTKTIDWSTNPITESVWS